MEDSELPGVLTADRIYAVINCFHNPTAAQDRLNFSLPQELQYPKTAGISYCYDDPDTAGPEPYIDHQLLRCYRDKHPDLASAQRFFNHKRVQLAWKAEGPVYRTARFWAKRVYGIVENKHESQDRVSAVRAERPS